MRLRGLWGKYIRTSQYKHRIIFLLTYWTHEKLFAAAIAHHVELRYVAFQAPRLLPQLGGRQNGQADLLTASQLHILLHQANAFVYGPLCHGHYLIGAIAARFNQAKIG